MEYLVAFDYHIYANAKNSIEILQTHPFIESLEFFNLNINNNEVYMSLLRSVDKDLMTFIDAIKVDSKLEQKLLKVLGILAY